MPKVPPTPRRYLAKLTRLPFAWPPLALVPTVAVGASVIQARAAGDARRAAEAHRPVQVESQRYVSSNECRSCHPREYESWFSSYHRTMTQLAAPETVMGRFDGVK